MTVTTSNKQLNLWRRMRTHDTLLAVTQGDETESICR